MDVEPSSRLGSLQARPPTPPRGSTRPSYSLEASQLDVDETLDDAVQFLDDSFEVERLTSSELRTSSFLVDTPQQSPSTTSDTSRTSSKRKHKVAFAPFTSWDYHKSPNYTIAMSGQTPVKPLPPSRENGSVKSILKSTKQPLAERLHNTSSPRNQNCLSAYHFSTFPEMLEAIIQQLAGDTVDRSTKVDAYVALCRTLQAYKEVPDIDALKNKTSLLLQFIRRDISSHNVAAAGPHNSIMTAALKLLACLLGIPTIAEAIDDQSCTSFIDLSISTLEDGNVSKTVAQHHLFALTFQRFTVRTLRPERFGRLLDAVYGLQDRIKGNKIPEYQIGLYRRLLEHVPDLMALSISKWLDILLSSLLSDVDEIRTRAINMGLFASVQLAGKSGVSDFISQAFERDSEGQPYGEFFVSQLHRMLSNNSTATSVPRVWSVICMLCRANFSKSWVQQNLKLWLSLIQACLGYGHKTKIVARAAWSRYILCVNPSLSTDSSERARLRIPIDAYFVDETTPETSTECTRGDLSMYCALLYYSLRPNAPSEHIDRYWKEYVADVIKKLAYKSRDHAVLACQILTSLFESAANWRETRAVEETMFTIKELPRLDPKWVRSRISSVLDLLRTMVQCAGQFNSLVDSDSSPVERMWTAFINSIADAGSKEITLSQNMKAAVANLTNFFYSQHLPPSIASPSVPLLGRLIENTITGLGASAFAEPFLSLVDSKLEVAASPKRRPAETVCAVPYLFVRLYSLPHDAASDIELCSHIAANVLRLCCQSKKSRLQKLEFLLKCAHAAKRSWDDETFGEQHCSSATVRPLLECAHDIFSATALESGSADSQAGRDYERALQLMQKCHTYTTLTYLETFEAFYSALVDTARAEAGDAGVLLAVTEEHAAFVASGLKRSFCADEHLNVEFLLRYASVILKHDVRPKKVRGELQTARVALWGEAAKFARDRRAEDLDPYRRIYDLVNAGLELVYKAMQDVENDFVADFLDSVHEYIEHTPASFRSVVVSKIQSGIAVLVHDQSRMLNNYPVVRAKVKKLWNVVLVIICDLNQYTSNSLNAFETIIAAGLSSSRKSTINAAVTAWNSTFGTAKTLDYTSKVERSLRRLRPFVDLELPNWKESTDEIVLESALALDESDEDTGSERDLPRLPRQLSHPPTAPRIRVPLQRDTTKRRTRSPRLTPRDNDSQIDFNPVESSPAQGHDSQDRQKDVAAHRCQDVKSLFYGVQSKPVDKRFQHREDMCSEPVQERPSTPVFADVSDAVEGDLPKSSSPPASSPIVSAMSRRSTPRKPLEVDCDHDEDDDLPKSSSPPASSPIVSAMSRRSTPRKPLEVDCDHDEDDDLPSSPPLRRTDALDDETESFDIEMQEAGAAGFDDIQQDEAPVDATINPTRLTVDVEVSHDDIVEQARQRFEAGSSFSSGTDIIAGTDDGRDDEMQSVLIPATDGTPGKDAVLSHAATATNEAQLGSPALSSSGFLAEAQLIADAEASTLTIRDEENCETPQSMSTSVSEIPSTAEKSFSLIPATITDDIDSNMQQSPTASQSSIPLDHITTSNSAKRKAEPSQFDTIRVKVIRRHSLSREVEASTSPISEPSRPHTPDFDKLEDASLHRILEVFNQQPDASFDEIVLTTDRTSRENYTESGHAKRFKKKEARDAWNKMSQAQRDEALREREDAARQPTQEQVVRKRGRPRGSKSQSRSSAADQRDANSSPATNQSRTGKTDEVTTPQSARATNQVTNLERPTSRCHSEMSDVTDAGPVLVRDSLSPHDRRRTKRRSSQLIAPQEKADANEPDLTEPRRAKKPRTEADDAAFQHIETPPRDVPRRRATDVRLTPRIELSLSSQDHSPPATDVGINATMTTSGEGFFSVRQANTPPPFVLGTYNEEASSPALSPRTFFARFTSFSDKWRKMFEDCKRVIGRLPSQERQQVEEKLEEMGDELRDVTKLVGKANKKSERSSGEE